MATPRPRSAALLISLYLDEAGGAGWYAQLRAFDDPTAPESRPERVAGEAELLAHVRRWLDDAVKGPAVSPDTGGRDAS
jgi:hypothetical protein